MKTTKSDIILLASAIAEHNLTAVEYKDSEFSLRLEKSGVDAPLLIKPKTEKAFETAEKSNADKNKTQMTEEVTAKEEVAASDLFKLTSPIVGNFYTAKKPGEAPFVKVGDEIKTGDVVAIIEAMKVMNEIKSPVDGIIREINFADGEFVDTLSELMDIEER